MRILVKLKTGEEGMIVGYAPGKKGRVQAIILISGKFRQAKLRQLECIGYAKIREATQRESNLFTDLNSIPESLLPH